MVDDDAEDRKVEVEEVRRVEVRVVEGRVAVRVVRMSVRVVMPMGVAVGEGLDVCWDD